MSEPAAATRTAVGAFLEAIESRNLRVLHRTLTPDATWQNVPHAPARGREEVVAFLAGILTWADEVRWDIVSASYDGRRAWLERIDRFRLDGEWHEVRCNGIIDVDDAGLVRAVRDYVDLAEWRARIQPVLQRLASRTPTEVVDRHLSAVRNGDVVSMAADYSLDAVLVRGPDLHHGWQAIAEYFEGVPDRLGGRQVRFDRVTTTPTGDVQTRWTISDDRAHGDDSTGIDTFRVTGGRIVHQSVALLGDDF